MGLDEFRADVTAKPSPMALLQEQACGELFDYEPGSPHLRHNHIRGWIIDTLRRLIAEQFAAKSQVRVLEVGAGHGSFTDHILATGATVTVTEMSRPSVTVLEGRYASNPAVRVIYDADGEAIIRRGDSFDLVVCISVLHHIPNYIGAVCKISNLIESEGSFASFQDPLWYPRRVWTNMTAHRAAYVFWRLGRGELVPGAVNTLRRMTGTYDKQNPADMVEYHVVRDGCDELALSEALSSRFSTVDLLRYWSTQAAFLQHLGERICGPNTFAAVARGRNTKMPSHEVDPPDEVK